MHFVKELSKRHLVTVFADFSRTPAAIAFPGANIQSVNIGPLPNMYNSSGSRSVRHAFLYSLRARKTLQVKADILLTDQTPLLFMPLIWFYSKLNKSKLSVVWHEFWDYKTWSHYSRRLAPIGLLIQAYAILFSENIVVPSNRVLTQVSKSIVGKKATVISNGFQLYTREYSHQKKSKETSFRLELLYVGRLIKHKNVDFLVEVMFVARTMNLPWHLTVVGNGPMLDELFDQVVSLDLNGMIDFKKNLESSELERAFQTSHIFVFPSEREGYGISVAEALMHNLPVLVYDTPSNASVDLLTDDQLGRKIGLLDSKLWVDTIIELSVTDSVSIAEKFQETQKSWEEISCLYENFLLDVIESR